MQYLSKMKKLTPVFISSLGCLVAVLTFLAYPSGIIAQNKPQDSFDQGVSQISTDGDSLDLQGDRTKDNSNHNPSQEIPVEEEDPSVTNQDTQQPTRPPAEKIPVPPAPRGAVSAK